jgi:hypothetical protein
MLQALHEGQAVREFLYRGEQQVQAAAGVRMLTRRPSWLIGAAILVAAQLQVAPIRAQTPDYRLDSSGQQVVSLFNLSPGQCYATSISGRIVKRDFDARGVVPTGVAVEALNRPGFSGGCFV